MTRKVIGEANFPVLFTNAASPLTINTPDGANQTIEQDIVDMGSGNTFAGHRFWLVCAPFAGQHDALENPCVYYSDDGITWTVPAGLTNPLVPFPGGNAGTNYNSDPAMIYDPVINCLRVYNRQVINNVGTIYEMHSPDGVNWSVPYPLTTTINGVQDGFDAIMPSVDYNPFYKLYFMWVLNTSGSKKTFWKYASTDSLNWKEIGSVYLNPPSGYNLWHINVKRYKDYYVGCAQGSKTDNNVDGRLFFIKSIDSLGNGFVLNNTPIINAGQGNNFDNTSFYQSCLRNVDNQWWLWYTGINNDFAGTINNYMGFSKSK